MKMILQGVLLVALSFLLASCATLDKSECLEAEWKTIGFEDGADGLSPSYVSNHREACAEHGVKPDLDLYRAGHDQGLEVFCTPANGFKQGRTGKTHNDVCPAHLRGQFLIAYDTGEQLYLLDTTIEDQLREAEKLKTEKNSLDKRIKNLEVALVSGALSSSERQVVLDDFKKLQKRQAKIDIDIRDMELNAARMQGQYETLDANHPY